ncbi:MAG: ribosome maturation factor RimM [Candidatus Margulisbacteria bacterium]|nr:ribosome maturation factor RimM [Candidatus Margulisiibacteriota bacterium]
MYFPVARIIKPHGVKGELKLLPIKPVFSQLLLNQKQFKTENNKLKVSFLKEHKQGFIAKFADIDDMDAAEELRDVELLIETKKVLTFFKEEGLFFSEQWIGYRVEDEKKKSLGVVDNILYTGANEVLVVLGKEEVLVPVISEFILEVDDEKQIIKVVKPEYYK